LADVDPTRQDPSAASGAATRQDPLAASGVDRTRQVPWVVSAVAATRQVLWVASVADPTHPDPWAASAEPETNLAYSVSRPLQPLPLLRTLGKGGNGCREPRWSHQRIEPDSHITPGRGCRLVRSSPPALGVTQ
jgi:hypothetical protein